jgi:hypothetical protein
MMLEGQAGDICRRFPLGEQAAKLLQPNQTPQQVLDLFIQHQHFLDAVRLLAHALPRREAVWWTCVSVRAATGSLVPLQLKAIEAAERWTREADEEARRACLPAAQAAGFGTPGGCAALAAFLSGGSMTPAEQTAVPPAEHLTGQLAANGILLVVVLREPEKAADKYRRLLALGLEVARGTNRWKETRGTPPAATGPRH